MFNNFQKWFSGFARLLSLVYLAVFFIWSLKSLQGGQYLAGAVLQFLLIIGLLVWRRIRRVTLFFVPDEMLVCLPYMWALANSGTTHIWFDLWKFLLLVVFAVAMLSMPSQKNIFVGGLRGNALLQSVTVCVLFTMLFVTVMKHFFSSFSADLYRAIMLDLIVVIAGIPISIAAFYAAVATKSDSEDS